MTKPKLKEWASCPVEELTVEMVMNDKSPLVRIPREEIDALVARRLNVSMVAGIHPRQESSSIIKDACDGIYQISFFE